MAEQTDSLLFFFFFNYIQKKLILKKNVYVGSHLVMKLVYRTCNLTQKKLFWTVLLYNGEYFVKLVLIYNFNRFFS